MKTISQTTVFCVYVDVSNMTTKRVSSYITKIKNNFKELEQFEDVLIIYMPVNGGGTKIEILK